MRIRRTDVFIKDYRKLPQSIQTQVDKQLRFLVENPRHPSLHLKKIEGTDKYEIRITKGYRATLMVLEDTVELRRVGTHDLLKKEG
jgi:mRNA interferase RelE/StbE